MRISRAVRSRHLRRDCWVAWANDGIHTVNMLSGRGGQPAKGSSWPAASQQCALDIAQTYRQLGPSPADLQPPEGALRELLNKTGFYSDDRPDLASYAKESVSWPASGTSPMNLIDGLDGADRARLNDRERHMLRDPNEADEVRQRAGLRRPHCDKELFKSPKVYGDFLNRLADAGMVRFERAERREGVLGVFFVHVQFGQLRIVFDARILNSQFLDPPRMQLPSAAAQRSGRGNPSTLLLVTSAMHSMAWQSLSRSVLVPRCRLFALPTSPGSIS